MFVRLTTVAAVVLVQVLVPGSAVADPLDADAAARFVVGRVFAFSCYDGTRGAGRIQSDLSVAGTIQVKGNGPVRFVTLPPGTLKVKGRNVCAAVRGVPFEPCFNLDRTDTASFRGSVQGFNFAYCDFTHRVPRRPSVRTTLSRQQPSEPLQIQAAAAAPR